IVGLSLAFALLGGAAGCSTHQTEGNVVPPANSLKNRSDQKPFAQAKGAQTSHVVGDRMATSSIAPVVLSKQTAPSPFRFADIARDAGINFTHFSGMTGTKHFPTANGSGVALFDFDNDGWLDLYFATATLLPLGTAQKGPNRLYKNLGGNRFKDVTESAGV